MRRPFVAGNWKMHLTRHESVTLARSLREGLRNESSVDVAVFPPYPYLAAVADELKGSSIDVGAQDLHQEDQGAFTGSVSGAMLKDVGCTMVIVGHSERRHLAGDTLDVVRAKLRAAWRNALRPILCVGEKLEERDRGETNSTVERQLTSALEGAAEAQLASLTIAYEPVWAIGTGRNATAAQASEVHGFIRRLLGRLCSPELAQRMRIQYGGSVKPDNARELLSAADVDGALVGGASLQASSFMAIVRSGLPRARDGV
jgi:triosephosphate isomerase